MHVAWKRASDRLREELGQVGYETWIGPLNFIGVQGKTATIEAPNRFFRDWVNDRYLAILRASLAAELGEAVDVKLTLTENGNGHGSPPGAARSSPTNGNGNGNGHRPPAAPAHNGDSPRHDRHPQLNPRYTFAEFVVGSGNQFAHAAALAVANQPGEKYNPLFIYGGVGLGKTHLVTAIGH